MFLFCLFVCFQKCHVLVIIFVRVLGECTAILIKWISVVSRVMTDAIAMTFTSCQLSAFPCPSYVKRL